MNEAGKRALMEISSNRDTRKYEQHLAKSIALLKDSVGSTNDRLHSRTGHLEQIVSKRMERGDTEKSELETSIEKSAAKLSEEVIALTRQSEAALREMIDYRAELEDERTVIEQVHGEVNAQKPREPRPQRKPRRREPGDDEDADDLEDKDAVPQGEEEEDTEMGQPDDNTPYTGASEFLETIRRAKTDEYGRLSMHQRYGLNNDYISFKRTLHDAQYPDGVVALPDASNWFGADGRPVVSAADGQGILGRNDTQGEDDLVIAREVLSFRCPLTLTTMKDPYTSRVCKHTFEKEAIMVFIRDNNGHCKCPVCPAVSYHFVTITPPKRFKVTYLTLSPSPGNTKN